MAKNKRLDGQLCFTAFMPKSDWVATPISKLPTWRDAKRICVDLETSDKDLKELGIGVRRDGFVCGIAFAIEDGPAHYIPIAHSEGNQDADQAWAYLKDQAAQFSGDIVGAYLPYDLDYLFENSVKFGEGTRFCDVQLAEPLIYELRRSFSLQALAELYGLPGKDETLLREAASWLNVDPKGGMASIPAKYVGPYALQDVRLPLQLLRRQERKLDDLELWEAWGDECKVLPILVDIRRRGVKIDVDGVEQEELWALGQQNVEMQNVSKLCGKEVGISDLWKPDALASAFDAIGATPPLTPSTGKPSVTADWMAKLDHPVSDSILRARQLDKYRNTFLMGLRRYQVNGRIHPTFNQMRRERAEGEGGGQAGTISHRFSAEHPSPQLALKRNAELGPRYRGLWLPDDGCRWASGDWSQQEPRTTIHYANISNLPGAAEVAQRFRDNPHLDYHALSAEITGLPRKYAKQVYLAYTYGIGDKRLCESLGLPTRIITRRGRDIEVAGPEGQAIKDAFDKAAPYLSHLKRRCEQVAKRRGYVKCLGGARRNFPRTPGGDEYDWAHKALNAIIQTSCARQMKKALIAVTEAGHEMQISLHDEFDWSYQQEQEVAEVKSIMENCVQLTVPHVAEMDTGDNWGEAAFPGWKKS